MFIKNLFLFLAVHKFHELILVVENNKYKVKRALWHH